MHWKTTAAIFVALFSTVTGTAAAQDDSSENRDVQTAVSDASITARVETTYVLNKYLSAFNIRTSTRNGHVTLKGNVDSEVEKDLAERLAKSVDGVQGVTNELMVHPNAGGASDRVLREGETESDTAETMRDRSWSQQVGDETLRADVRTRLANTTGLSVHDMTVEVDDGNVELNGAVGSEEEKLRVERMVRAIRGVQTVQNNLTVDQTLQTGAGDTAETEEALERTAETEVEPVEEPAPSRRDEIQRVADDVIASLGDTWVEKRLEANLALNRNVSIFDLDVEVINGVATIDGHVISEQQRKVITDVAESTNGVTEVVNNVQVTDYE